MVSYELVELRGEFLRGARVHVTVKQGLIIACDEIRCVWTGTKRFDRWFRDLYSPVVVAIEGALWESQPLSAAETTAAAA